jgi:hypothetical protein
MNRISKSAVIAAALLLTAAPASPLVFAAQDQADVDRSFDVAAGGTLNVDASFGSIEVATGDNARVEIRVAREVRDRFEDDEQQILSEHAVQITQSGNDVLVTTTVTDDARERWRDEYESTPLRVRFEITVPRSYDVDLGTRGGNIEVADLSGEVRTETAGGNLTLGDIDGAVWARTSGGNVSLESASGTVEVRTSGGNITIGEVTGAVDAATAGGSIHIERSGGEVRAETAGGNITLDEVAGTVVATTAGGNVTATITAQPTGDSRLETSAGTVAVTLAAGIAVDVDASTSIGGVSTDFAVDGRVSRDAVRGTINGGGPELRLRSSAGSIRIREH